MKITNNLSVFQAQQPLQADVSNFLDSSANRLFLPLPGILLEKSLLQDAYLSLITMCLKMHMYCLEFVNIHQHNSLEILETGH